MKKLLSLALLALASASFAQVWDSGTGLGWSIPDNQASGVNWNFSPTGVSGTLTQFDIYMNPAHTWRGDLIIRLTDPFGNQVTLSNRTGGSGDYLSEFYSDSGIADPGTGNVDSATTGILYKAAINNVSSLSQGGSGTWNLFASDNAGADTGTIDRITVHTTPVPEPASLAALGVGALALIRRRRASK